MASELRRDGNAGVAEKFETESQGFVVESSGFLLTTFSTLLKPNTGNLLDGIKVEFPGEKVARYSATIVAVEPTLNIAILKIGADRPFPASRNHRPGENQE